MAKHNLNLNIATYTATENAALGLFISMAGTEKLNFFVLCASMVRKLVNFETKLALA